ncbi:MAG: metallophosphoesterase family protein, partial [Clostridia bacterium]|nr:metallophosphoesterase family protein [Clostridia bacterium]
HLYNAQRLPPHKSGDLLIHGHTHIPVIQKTGDMLYLNPGSLAIPKEGSPRSYMIYENGTFFLRKDTGETFNTYSL